jgi:hypothetical protein
MSARQVSYLFKQSISEARFKRTRRIFLRFLKRSDAANHQDVMQFLNECVQEYFKLTKLSTPKIAYYALYGIV